MVSNLQFHSLDAGHFLLSWQSDAAGTPVYRIYRDGVLVATQLSAHYRAAVTAGAFPVFEVLDNEEGDPSPVYPSAIQLGWYVSAEVESYDVQQYIDGDWVSKGIISNDGRSVYLIWHSDALADGQTHQFRVVPMGTNGNAGSAASVSALIVRNPDPPQPSFVYNSPPATWGFVQGASDTETGNATINLGDPFTPGSLLLVAVAVTGNPDVTIDVETESDAAPFTQVNTVPPARQTTGFESVQDFSAAAVESVDLPITPGAGNTLFIIASARASAYPSGTAPVMTLTSDNGLEADWELLEEIGVGPATMAIYRVTAAGNDTVHLIADQVDAGCTLVVLEYTNHLLFFNLQDASTFSIGNNPNLSAFTSSPTADRNGELILSIVCYPQADITTLGVGSGWENFRDINLDPDSPRLGIQEIGQAVAGAAHTAEFTSSGASGRGWIGSWIRMSSPAPPVVRLFAGVVTDADEQILITTDDPGCTLNAWCGEYSLPAVSPIDASAGGYGDESASPATGSISVSSALGGMILSAISFDPGGSIDSPGSGFTQRYLDDASDTPLQVQDKLTVPTAQTAGWTGNVSRWMAAGASFQRRLTGGVTVDD